RGGGGRAVRARAKGAGLARAEPRRACREPQGRVRQRFIARAGPLADAGPRSAAVFGRGRPAEPLDLRAAALLLQPAAFLPGGRLRGDARLRPLVADLELAPQALQRERPVAMLAPVRAGLGAHARG